MNSATKIEQVRKTVEETGFREKSSPLNVESELDRFLDAILDLKAELKAKTAQLETLTESVEAITWIKEAGEKELKVIYLLIALLKDLHSTLVRQYGNLHSIFVKKGIAVEEILDFRAAIEDLEESCGDLESVFFFHPNDEEFRNATDQLKEL